MRHPPLQRLLPPHPANQFARAEIPLFQQQPEIAPRDVRSPSSLDFDRAGSLEEAVLGLSAPHGLDHAQRLELPPPAHDLRQPRLDQRHEVEPPVLSLADDFESGEEAPDQALDGGRGSVQTGQVLRIAQLQVQKQEAGPPLQHSGVLWYSYGFT